MPGSTPSPAAGGATGAVPAAAAYRAMLAASGEALVLLDASARVTEWNAAATRLTGVARGAAVGRPIDALLPALAAGAREAIAAASAEPLALRAATSGGDGAIGGSAVAIVDEAGVHGAVLALRDLAPTEKSEATLMRERELRRAILDASPDALIAYDTELRVTEWPALTARNTGIARDDAIGRSVLELMPYIRGTPIEDEYRRSLAGETIDGRERSWTPAGSDRPHYYDITYYPLRDHDGRVSGGVVVTADTTERGGTDEVLTSERRLLRTILDANPHSLIAVDRSLRIVEWSAKSERASGLRRADVVGRPLLDVLPDLADSEVLRDYRHAAAGEGRVVRGREYAIPGAEPLVYDVVFAPMYDGQGAPIGAIVLSQDVTDRARAEAALSSERALLRAVLDAAPAGIVAFDEEMRVTEWNAGAEQMSGTPREAMIGRRGVEREPSGADWSPVLARAARVLAGERVRAEPATVKHAGVDEPAHVESSVNPIRDDAGRVVGGVAITVDVTERVAAERALAASEARFREMFEDSPVMQLLVDPASARIVDVNAAAVRYYGRPRSALVGVRPDALIQAPAGAIDAQIRTVLETGSTHARRSFVAPSGERREVEVNVTLLDAGRTPLLHAWMHDVTERVRAEVERDRLIRIVEMTTDLVAIGDADAGTVTYMNGAGRRLLGVGPDERELRIADFVADEDRALVFEEAFPAAMRDGVWRGEVRLRSRDGQLVPASVVLIGQRDAVTGGMQLSTVSRDVTLEKRREAELDAARDDAVRGSQAKSAMLAGLSHELRTPLGAVIGFAQLLRDGRAGALTPEQAEYVDDVLAGGGHLLRVVNDALDLARVEAGVVELAPEPVDLGALVTLAMGTVDSLARARRVVMSARVDAAAAAIVADPGRVRQVLFNFLSNAIKYNREGGSVEVVVAPDDEEHVRLTVRDSGVGIASDDMGRLFMEFQRFGTDREVAGSGLGLAISKRLVEAMGGTVSVESVPGAGSAFHARLPRRPRA